MFNVYSDVKKKKKLAPKGAKQARKVLLETCNSGQDNCNQGERLNSTCWEKNQAWTLGGRLGMIRPSLFGSWCLSRNWEFYISKEQKCSQKRERMGLLSGRNPRKI